MNITELKGNLKNSLKQKNIKNLVLILLVVIMSYLTLSYFSNVNHISNNEDLGATSESIYTLEGVENISAYEEKQQQDLKKLLEKMEGVGSVEVKINYKSSEVKVPAVDNATKKNTTEETDTEGGVRNNTEESNDSAIVMTNDDEPLVLQTNKPNITGIIIVAEGSENSKIKYNIQKAVSSLYDIGMDKVSVLSMKENSSN
ncbi:MAG: stage III sporulation protein AG [Clostridium perfringens]|nr:stage III sporulation protein AG [Clostridium perfringens]